MIRKLPVVFAGTVAAALILTAGPGPSLTVTHCCGGPTVTGKDWTAPGVGD